MRPVASASPAEGAPAFLAKLWQLVHEQRSNHLISWAPGGKSFIIKDQIDFARKLLPLYYKHNNMASFIRQLNMYGFHKVVSVDNGGLKSENEEVQFSHPYFQVGQPLLLQHIKRKIANSNKTNTDDKAILKPELMTKVLIDVKHMKGRQESLDARFTVMKHENEALWREVALLRQKHVKQQQIVNNLIQFLMSLAQPSRNGPLKTGVKRRYQLMINDAAHHNDDDFMNRSNKNPKLEGEVDLDDDEDFNMPDMEEEEGPTIHEVPEQDHGETSANSLLNSDFDPHLITSPGSSIYASPSPAASATSLGAETFDIVAEDIDEPAIHSLLLNLQSDLSNDSPLYGRGGTSESTDAKSLLIPSDSTPSNSSKSNKNKSTEKRNLYGKKRQTHSTPAFTINSQPSTTLPINIFDSDETNSQDDSGLLLSGLSESDSKAGLQLMTDEDFNSKIINDDYFNTMVSGNYNPNITLNPNSISKGKSKAKKGKVKDSLLKNIKEEIINPDDDLDANNMTLAVLPNDKPTRPILNRFNSVEDVDDHLHSMQNEIENLRELLLHSGESYTLDANTLLGLFHEEPIFGLSVNPSDLSTDKPKEPSVEDIDSQLISYVPPVNSLGFDDFELDDEINEEIEQVRQAHTEEESTSLNTPQVQLLEPKFPKDSID